MKIFVKKKRNIRYIYTETVRVFSHENWHSRGEDRKKKEHWRVINQRQRMKLIGVNSITLSRKISTTLARKFLSLSLSLLPTRFLREPGNNILTAVIKKSSSRNERRAESRQENSITLSRRKYELDQSSLPRLYMKKKKKERKKYPIKHRGSQLLPPRGDEPEATN